jgi:signal transduction histidine kinase
VGARKRTEAERERLLADAQLARAEAEAANQAKSQFLSTMSHELRTPLNAIAGYAELLMMELRGPLTDSQRQDLDRIHRANQHLMSLVNDVLNFARLDAGQIEYHLVDFDLASTMADLEPFLGPQIAAKGISFQHDACTFDTPAQPHRVHADPEKLRQILLNLLTNAVKFTDRGGHVSVRCETDAAAGTVRIHVSDTGRGIPADQLQSIFEPFVQIERNRTQESQQGVGLGLAISRDLARGMGGSLTAESEVGVGSTFTVTLPLASPVGTGSL